MSDTQTLADVHDKIDKLTRSVRNLLGVAAAFARQLVTTGSEGRES